MKIVLFFGLLASATSACGSYELMLVADNGGRDIDRYDPVTGTYLGSFGAGFLGSPTDIDVDTSSGLAYVVDSWSNTVKVFNYNTGEFIRNWGTGTSNYYVTRLSSGNILVSDYGYSNSKQFSPTGVLIRTQNTSSANVQGHAQSSDGYIWWMDYSGKRLMRGSETNLSPAFMYGHINPTGQWYLSASANEMSSMDLYSGQSISMTRFTLTSGLVTGETWINVGATVTEYSAGTAFGHGGVIYGALTTSTSSRYVSWVRGDNFVVARPLVQTANAAGMAVVVAPEPTGVIVLSAGVLALLRRRKSKRS